MTVVVIDYGVSNLDSVRRAFEEVGATVKVTSDPEELALADHIVLPGVGAFPVGMENLTSRGLDEALKSEAAAGAPILGICLGMQLLAAMGTEAGGAQGLGLVPGIVDRLVPTDDERRIPHVGWNEVYPTPASRLFDGIAAGTDFYFVHSFEFRCDEPRHEEAKTPYMGGFTSAVRNESVLGVQFHPEKSQRSGFAVIQNFLA